MTEAEKLREELLRDEGFIRSAYRDSAGWWTIGIGRMIDERLGGGITRAEADVLLDNDIAMARADLSSIFPLWVHLPEDIRRGLVNMAFNMGRSKLAGFKKMFAALEAEDYQMASVEALDSVWAYQVGERANRIAKLFRES